MDWPFLQTGCTAGAGQAASAVGALHVIEVAPLSVKPFSQPNVATLPCWLPLVFCTSPLAGGSALVPVHLLLVQTGFTAGAGQAASAVGALQVIEVAALSTNPLLQLNVATLPCWLPLVFCTLPFAGGSALVPVHLGKALHDPEAHVPRSPFVVSQNAPLAMVSVVPQLMPVHLLSDPWHIAQHEFW